MAVDADQRNAYLRLAPSVSLRYLEQAYLYHKLRDELYELDAMGMHFLLRCDGSRTWSELAPDKEFVDFCLEEKLLETLASPEHVPIFAGKSPVPSLRYLELQLLHRCNLACRHCYLGASRPAEMKLEEALAITGQFEQMGGLRLIISGGEPLLYPRLRDFIEETAHLNIRRILLTNGTLINRKIASWLRVEEIQFSLDGWRRGHDMLRGSGSFDKTMLGIDAALSAGVPVSVATMIHRGNIEDFEMLRQFTEEIGALQWGVDILCIAGSLENNRDLIVSHEEAAPLMEYSYGGGYHGSTDGFACGRHLMTVMPSCQAVKCGFFEEKPLGDARNGLEKCWLNLEHIPLSTLECRSCPVLDECHGGCRFRAAHHLAPDRAMCAFYGINPDRLGKRNQ
jgi:radical SAM protein with 4Fe4S-binding SPASM domain